MPRYHFNIHDGTSSPDEDGSELDSFDTARNAALKMTGEILRCDTEGFKSGRPWEMSVTDAAGTVLFTLMVVSSERASTTWV